jgi:uncharacterized protein (TIGR03083 family)
MDDTKAWTLIHSERAAMADTLATLSPSQWAEPSSCDGWSVRVTAGHIVVGAEQTRSHFLARMAANGFRFNTMMDRDARRVGEASTGELVERLRARLTTTNRPPAPVLTMLGEVVVHSDDIRRPLGLQSEASAEAVVACLDMYKDASFPVGTKKRIAGLRLVATDVDWTHGAGPEVRGPGLALLSAMTGRTAGLKDLGGDGLTTLTERMSPRG